MKRHRHMSEQAVRKLRGGDRMLNEGKDMVQVLRNLEYQIDNFASRIPKILGRG